MSGYYTEKSMTGILFLAASCAVCVVAHSKVHIQLSKYIIYLLCCFVSYMMLMLTSKIRQNGLSAPAYACSLFWNRIKQNFTANMDAYEGNWYFLKTIREAVKAGAACFLLPVLYILLTGICIVGYPVMCLYWLLSGIVCLIWKPDDDTMQAMDVLVPVILGTIIFACGLMMMDKKLSSARAEAVVRYNQENSSRAHASVFDSGKDKKASEKSAAYDPFENGTINNNGMVITYSGASPYASIHVRNKFPADDPRSRITFSASKSTNIVNGEEITISAVVPKAMQDMKLTRTSYKMKAVRMDTYITKADHVSQTLFERMKKDCAKKISSSGMQFIYGKQKLSAKSLGNIEYQNLYVLTRKDKAPSEMYIFVSWKTTSEKSFYGMCTYKADLLNWPEVLHNGTCNYTNGMMVNPILYSSEEDLKKAQINIYQKTMDISEITVH